MKERTSSNAFLAAINTLVDTGLFYIHKCLKNVIIYTQKSQ